VAAVCVAAAFCVKVDYLRMAVSRPRLATSVPGHFYAMPTYPANLCPLSGRPEFAGLREDLGQPIGEPVEAVSRRAVRQGSAEHFDCVLSEEQ
jgi:hypothetical protein